MPVCQSLERAIASCWHTETWALDASDAARESYDSRCCSTHEWSPQNPKANKISTRMQSAWRGREGDASWRRREIKHLKLSDLMWFQKNVWKSHHMRGMWSVMVRLNGTQTGKRADHVTQWRSSLVTTSVCWAALIRSILHLKGFWKEKNIYQFFSKYIHFIVWFNPYILIYY